MSRNLEVRVKCESCKDIFKIKVVKPSVLQRSYSLVKCTGCGSEYRAHAEKPRGGKARNEVMIGLEPIKIVNEKKQKCTKCGAISGDDWSQCQGECPMPRSPFYKKLNNTPTDEPAEKQKEGNT